MEVSAPSARDTFSAEALGTAMAGTPSAGPSAVTMPASLTFETAMVLLAGITQGVMVKLPTEGAIRSSVLLKVHLAVGSGVCAITATLPPARHTSASRRIESSFLLIKIVVKLIKFGFTNSCFVVQKYKKN